MNKTNYQLTIKHITEIVSMGWAVTICADNTGKHKHYILLHDGYETEMHSTGDNIPIIIDAMYNRIIRF